MGMQYFVKPGVKMDSLRRRTVMRFHPTITPIDN